MKDKEINRLWKRIVNTMNDGLMLIGTDGSILMVNSAFERMTGYRAEEIMGRSCTLMGCDACEGRLRQGDHFWCTLFERVEDVRCRCSIRKKDGTLLPVLKNASLLEDDAGKPAGAVETFTDLSELDAMDRKLTQLSRQMDAEEGFHGIIGKSPVMQRTFEIIRKAAQSDAPVIIQGESGTGKELAARAIHELGPRREGPFAMINCAALNESLLERAFTGAYRHRRGRFEAAHGGDIFLDEIGDIPQSMQVKLLRVLESRAFERVGEQEPVSVDVRFITATNRDLDRMIADGSFRQDFFFRINVIPIHLPPLRERKEDIPLLVSGFIERFRQRSGKTVGGVSAPAMEMFMAYDWPGNVRELRSALEYGFVVAEGEVISLEHLPRKIREGEPPSREQAVTGDPGEERERQALVDALIQAGGNQTRAAGILGVNRVTVWNRMRRYGIDVKKIIARP
jgi:PAS domain S-box-containing protein